MIASLKGYGRIARTVLTVVAGLLVLGIAGSLWMGVRAHRQAAQQVIDQATAITDNSLALAFMPADLNGAVSSARAAQLSDQVRSIVMDPSEFTDVTLMSPDGHILYSTKLSLIGSDLPGQKSLIQAALSGTVQTTDAGGIYAVTLPLKLKSGVGDPAAVVLERSDATIANASGPWKTNALFLFSLLVLLGVAVFGVARVLSVVTSDDRIQLPVRAPKPQQLPAPLHPIVTPHHGLREEGDARRQAEDRARAAEERLGLLQEQYRKALDDLQEFQRSGRDTATRGPDPRIEERALRAEGQVAALQQQIQTLASERERLATQVQDQVQELSTVQAGDPLADARARQSEREVEGLRGALDQARRELMTTQRELDALRSGAGSGVTRAELDAAHTDAFQAKDALETAQGQLRDAQRQLDDSRQELRALRNEEARAAMLEDELRSTKAEIESFRASHRADLVEREAEFEEKVRDTREEFQRQLGEVEQSYRGQMGQRESDLADRVARAEEEARVTARELESTRSAMQAARAEAESREHRLIQAAGELAEHRGRIAALEQEIKERTVAVGQARKEADDMRRSTVGLQADLQRVDESVTSMYAELETERARSQEMQASSDAITRERAALTERVDKLARMLESAAAENAELNRRLQDFEARRQLELASDQGRTQIDDLLRVTQERLAGQTEKLIATEDRIRELETVLQSSSERLEIAEADLRTHQMSEALREMRETEAAETVTHETMAPIERPDDRRSTTSFVKELSSDAKQHLSRINGISQLLKHQKGAKEQAQLLKQLAAYTRRLDATVSDLSEADRLVLGTIELQPRRTDLEALVARVVEESELGADHEVRVTTDSVSMSVDPFRTEQILLGLLRSAGERTSGGKPIVVRLQHVDGGAVLSVEDPEPASDGAMSPVVRRLADIQGGWAKVESRDGGGSAFRVFLPDASTRSPSSQPQEPGAPEQAADSPIVVAEAYEPPAPEPELSPEQILSQELRRLAEAESSQPASSGRRRGRR